LQLFKEETLFHVEQHLHTSRKDIIDFYKKNIQSNEGVIVRSSSGITYKIKPIITIDLVVLGYALKENEDSLRELLLGFVVDDNQYQIITRCSSGFSEKERLDILNKLKPLHCESDYTEVSGAKTAFMPSTAPSAIPNNEYYKTEEDYFHAVGEAMRTEYLAIVEAGFLVQIDDPFMADLFVDMKEDQAALKRKADLYVEVINHAIRGIPQEKVRFHTCYGINEGPRIHESSLQEMIGHILQINAGYYSFEGANCRHEHEYHVFEDVKLPDGKVVIPGVITHASNIVEHPELIAERIMRYAKLCGRENVIAGADCGFSSQACYHPEVHPTVMWEKFRAMVEGARIASRKLWS
jgi:hypothetical protein